MTSCHADRPLTFDERSTTVGSAMSEAWGDDITEEVHGAWSSQEESTEDGEDEEEEGAREEAEFSLDGRLATMKKWRRFRALEAAGRGAAAAPGEALLAKDVSLQRPSLRSIHPAA